MKFLFIDADVLIDVVLKRTPFYTSAAKILALTEQVEFVCCTTVSTLLNVHAVLQKQTDKESADNAVGLLTSRLQIIVEGKEVLNQALTIGFPFFEDAVKHFAAVNASCNAIITRNSIDYKNSNIPVLTPEQFLNTL